VGKEPGSNIRCSMRGLQDGIKVSHAGLNSSCSTRTPKWKPAVDSISAQCRLGTPANSGRTRTVEGPPPVPESSLGPEPPDPIGHGHPMARCCMPATVPPMPLPALGCAGFNRESTPSSRAWPAGSFGSEPQTVRSGSSRPSSAALPSCLRRRCQDGTAT
jgi:hypothetical protein